MATKRKFNEEETVLKNRGACDFSFKPFMMSTFVNVQSNCVNASAGLPINVGLLRNTIMSDIGVQRKFESNELYVEDMEIMKFLGVRIEKSELMKTYSEIIKMLEKGTVEELEYYLNELMDEDNEECAQVMVNIIERAAIDMKLSNMTKIKLIKDYTGKLINEVLESLIEEEDTQTTKKKSAKKNNKKGTGFEE